MQIGIVGLGKMGSGIATKLVNDGHEVGVWNRTQEDLLEFKNQNPSSETYSSIEALIKDLDTPCVIWIMVPHKAVEEVLGEIKKFVEKGDIIIDGGNSNYKKNRQKVF